MLNRLLLSFVLCLAPVFAYAVDLTQTAANVGLSGNTGQVKTVQAGATVTQGDAIYLDGTVGTYKPADVTTSAATAAAVGIALTPAASDGYFVIALDGCTVDLGATLSVGTIYVVSASGAISPSADLTTGDYPCILGTATAADTLILNISASGVITP